METAGDAGSAARRDLRREERLRAAEAHDAALRARKAEETERARRLITEFVAAARERGIAPAPLRARDGSGATYRTGRTGWSIRRDGSLAIGEDGEFYLLSVLLSPAARLRARLTGVTVEPSDPPIHLGVGARDGESVPLVEQLQARLEAGDDWPS